MKKPVRISFIIFAVLLMSVIFGNADGHSYVNGSVWIGPGWYTYNPYYVPPPVVIQQPAPEIYIQPLPQAEEPNYWYYCQNPKGYYPYVKQCPSGWMKVVPFPTPQQGKE